MSPQKPYEIKPGCSNVECKGSYDECVKTGYQYANVSVPIELKPSTKIGDIVVECCSEPVVDCCENKCENKCEITVTQKVCIKIPIHYQIDACVGESVINCDYENK